MISARQHTNGTDSRTVETHKNIAAKLRAAGYLEPSGIQLSSDEAHDLALARCGVTPPATLCNDCDGETEAAARYLRAREIYLRELARKPTLSDRLVVIVANLWPKIGHAFVSLLIILATFFALLIGCAVTAKAADVPAWVIRGIASQENGVHWNDTGDIDGKWVRGTTGAVGPWHISLDVLSDLKLSAHADRLHRDPVYAESITRLWLLRLHSVTGCWHQTCAAWRAGLRNRHRAWARAYAERAFNYGTTY